VCSYTHDAQVLRFLAVVVETRADPVRLPRKRMSRVEQNENKRRLLLASALEVLIEQGYQGMTLEEVAERAGFTRRPIYTLFGSKEQLALAVFEEQIIRFTDEAIQMSPARTLAGTLKRLAKRHAELTAGDSFLPIYELQLALNGVALRDESIRAEVVRFLDEQHANLIAWLTEICESTGQGFRLPLETVARIITAGFDGLMNLGYLDPTYHEVELRNALLTSLVAD
jgi:AcrR family transcriptional regulator